VAARERFVWDLWHVEGQYTALRTRFPDNL
jgi:hypothetical protein